MILSIVRLSLISDEERYIAAMKHRAVKGSSTSAKKVRNGAMKLHIPIVVVPKTSEKSKLPMYRFEKSLGLLLLFELLPL